MKTTLILLSLMLPVAWTRAETPVQAWAQRHTHTPGSMARAQKVVTDAAGNAVVAGYSDDGSRQEIVVLKYSASGSVLWTNRFPGPADTNKVPIAVGVDKTGNVFVAGSSLGDYVVLAYSGAGAPLWTNNYGGPIGYPDQPSALAVDGDGNVIVTGFSWGDRNGPDYLTIKYSAVGSPLWTNRFSTSFPAPEYAKAVAVATDTNGNVFVAGYAWPSIDAGYAYVTIKYSSIGELLWIRTYSIPISGHSFATALTVDSAGNVIVTGYSQPISVFLYTTIKYSGDGVALWTNRSQGGTMPRAIATDSSGNVFVTGSRDTSTGGPTDYHTVACSSAGVSMWSRDYDGPAKSNDVAYALAVDAGGNVFVTGSSYAAGNGLDYVTLKYSGAGQPLWTNRYNGAASGDDEALSAALGPDGTFYVTGASAGHDDSRPGASDFFTAKYFGVSPITLHATVLTNSGFGIAFTNLHGATFSARMTTNLALPVNDWMVIGTIPEIEPGHFQFADLQTANNPWRFYYVTSP